MKISELFRHLSYGELSNLDLSGEGSGSIKEARHPQIIGYINDGLLKIYSRFLLLQKQLVIELNPAVVTYPLRIEFAESSGSGFTFIKDKLNNKFTGDVIKILEVHSSSGCELPLNDKGHCASLFTPQPDTLQVPAPETGVALAVQYQARHPKLNDQGTGYLDQDIKLPFFLEPALRIYVGHKVYSHMNGNENTAKSQEFAVEFERLCTEIEQKDLVNDTFSTSQHKLESRGFI